MTYIYVDGSYCSITRRAGIGITHKNLSLRVKARDSLSAELIAVIYGVKASTTLDDVVLTDCRVIVEAVKIRRMIVRHELLCDNLYSLLKLKPIEIRWVKRENNRKADRLARLGRLSSII